MNKKEMVDSLSKEMSEISKHQWSKIVDLVGEAMLAGILQDGEVTAFGHQGIGNLRVKIRKSRKARNIQTGKEILVPEKAVIVFKPAVRGAETAEKYRQAKAKESPDGKKK